MKVLIAEDDPDILAGLDRILRDEGYETLTAPSGESAWNLFEREAPDFVCLDIMMPGLDGYEVCRRIRRTNEDVPVIFISARSEEVDKVLGLELGADDYIMKPFGVREVVARIRAVTRRCIQRSARGDDRPFPMGDLEVLPAQLRVRRDETLIDVSLRDMSILRLLHRMKGEVVDRARMFEVCWGLNHVPNSRTLDQQISQLRKRIERDPKDPQIIRTVYGAGYRYEE